MISLLELDPEMPVIIQGATGRTGRRHAELMKSYGTNVVGGVTGRNIEESIPGLALFPTCGEAVAVTGARASVALVPPMSVLAAVTEAVEAGVKLIVAPSEGMPVHDALRAVRLATQAGAVLIGPSTPGLAIPGRMKLGFIPDASLAPGPLAVMSRSGTLSYEVCYRLKTYGLGQSIWVGVGGDPVKGVRFADLLPFFAADYATRAVVVIGEIGGTEEEDLAAAITRLKFQKPVYTLLAGSSAPQGVTMGHAGALVQGNGGTAQSKMEALQQAGATVFSSIRELIEGVVHGLA
jgi:succinyl-CoA synthetase alpha subunit